MIEGRDDAGGYYKRDIFAMLVFSVYLLLTYLLFL